MSTKQLCKLQWHSVTLWGVNEESQAYDAWIGVAEGKRRLYFLIPTMSVSSILQREGVSE